MIDGVKIIKLNPISDERGWLMEIFKISQTNLKPKQVYLSVVKKGVVKDKDKFHAHEKQWDGFCCIKGKTKLVLIDKRENSKTKDEIMELEIGEGNFNLVLIPPMVLHAFKGLEESFVISCVTEEYNKDKPDELRIKNEFYKW